MRGGSRLFIIAGIGLALVAVALIAVSAMSGDKTDAKDDAQATKITVVEAVGNVPAHRPLTAADVVEREVEDTNVPADVVTSVSQAIGQSYREALVEGQQLVMSKLEQPGLRNEIANGKRAVSLPVDQKNLLSGLIQDDDYIDVVFDARVNPVRILPALSGEAPEDEPYYSFASTGEGDSGGDSSGGNNDQTNEDDSPDISGQEGGSVGWILPGFEDLPQFPAAGDPGSKMYVRDDIREEQQLEPVAKVLIQDVKVLRVVRPGEQYEANGQISGDGLTEEAAPASDQPQNGYLILEVTTEQAEVLAFMQDERHDYQVIVRAKDDHEMVSTTGITFYWLNENYEFPVPRPVTLPEEQTRDEN